METNKKIEYIVPGGFECDKLSKKEYIISTTNKWKESLPHCEIEWYGSDDECNLVPLGQEKSTSRIDLYMIVRETVVTENGEKIEKVHKYAMEVKERWKDKNDIPYHSTYYGEEGQEGWIYNMDKDSFLHKAMRNGYIPIYGNLYPDNKIRIWQINKIPRERIATVIKPIKKQNVVVDSERIPQQRYTLMNADGKIYDRIRIKE